MGRHSKLRKSQKLKIEAARRSLEAKRRTHRQADTVQPAPPATSDERDVVHVDAVPARTSSAEKRKRLSYEEKEEELSEEENLICKKSDIREIAKHVTCNKCKEHDVTSEFVHHQCDVIIKLVCSNCKHIVYDSGGSGKMKCGDTGLFMLTAMIIYLVKLLGHGYAAVERFCSILSMRHFSFVTYGKYTKFINEHAVENVNDILKRSREAVFQYYAENLNRHPDENGILDIDATYDGSWHKRGYKSNYGISAVVDAHTNLILDYETMSKVCSVCDAKKKKLAKREISAEQYEQWKMNHVASCSKNYEGTSGGMEPEGAKRIWNRSIDYNLRYVNFISDGDTSTFLELTQMNNGEGPYGMAHQVTKEECVSHVQKRLGTALRNLGGKQRVKAGYGGTGKLTEITITRLEYYFGQSLKKKVNTSPEEMRDCIMSSFFHCSSTDANPCHHLCPKSEQSWCFYEKAKAKGETPPSHTTMRVKFDLAPEQLENVKKVYTRLTTDEMMTRCMRGKTQNANESLHARVWNYCPKHINTTKRQVDFAVATAVSNFNVGYLASDITTRMGIPLTTSMKRYLDKKDSQMNAPINKKMRNKKLEMELAYERGAH